MCGIVGMVSFEPVAARLAAAAERLQSRGEHSTGVSTSDGRYFYDHGGLGPAPTVFHNYDLGQLKGAVGIAHTRYATTGGGSRERLLRNRQPVGSDRPGLRTCANGDLVNLHARREALKLRGFSFQTEVDAKVIQNTLIEHLFATKAMEECPTDEYAERLFRAVEGVDRDLVGAYSCLTITDRGLLAFKDPNGIRPMCMATRKRSGEMFGGPEVVFASESSVLNYFGDYDDIREVEPGEAIFVERDTGRVIRRRLSDRRGAFCFFEFVYFARPDSKFKGRVVESARRDLGAVLAEEHAAARRSLDVVVGIPGTGVSAGVAMARALGLPFENAVIKVGNKRSFQETSPETRMKAIDDKFLFVKEFVDGKRVGVVDDSNVRGTTARKIVRRLRDVGAREVHLFYFCPRVIGPCYYGIDTPDEGELIAAGRSDAEIAAWIGADSVNYVSVEGLIRGLKLQREELCLACVTKQYPTPIPAADERLTLRKAERGCAT